MANEFDTNIEQSTNEVNTNVKYNKSDATKIKSAVINLFDLLNNDRQTQVDIIDVVEDMLNVKDSNVKDKDDKIIPYLKDPAISRILDTAKSQTYNSTFKNPQLMFNTELVEDYEDTPMPGEQPEQSQEELEADKKNQTLIQKQVILEVIKRSNAKSEFRKGVTNFYKKGEFILRLTWSQEYDLVKGTGKFQYQNDGIDIQMDRSVVKKELSYDGVKIKCIDPKDFIWDTSYDNFKDAPKMSRIYQPFSVIKKNDVYKEFLTKEDYDLLENMVKTGKTNNANLDDDYAYDDTKGVKGKQLEVIEFEGELFIGDKLYENMKIVIIARQCVACFMYNPQLTTSYLYSAYDVDEDTGRGIGLIARLMATSQATTDVLRKLHRALGLSINKCYLAPEGTFSGGLEIIENAIIEYKKNAIEKGELLPLEFQTALNICMSYLQYLKGEMEESTMRFKYGSGDSPKQAQTLGQVQIITEAQNTLSSFELDKLYDEIIIPMAEMIGQMVANFEEGERRIKYTNHLGENSVGIVDDTVRTAKYSYEINEPQNSAAKKLNNINFLDAMMTKLAPYMASTGQGKLSAKELLSIIGGSFDIINPDKLILQEQPVQPQPAPQPNVGGLPETAQGVPEPNQNLLDQTGINGGINLQALGQQPDTLQLGG